MLCYVQAVESAFGAYIQGPRPGVFTGSRRLTPGFYRPHRPQIPWENTDKTNTAHLQGSWEGSDSFLSLLGIKKEKKNKYTFKYEFLYFGPIFGNVVYK